jgi:hypothetical protein
MRRPSAAFAVLIAAIACFAASAVRAQQTLEDFFIFVANDRVADVKALLARGMDPDSVDKNGDPAIVVAARAGSAASLDVLLATKLNVNARNRFGTRADGRGDRGNSFVKNCGRAAPGQPEGWSADLQRPAATTPS